MNTSFITAALALFAVATAPACGSKEAGGAAPAAESDNPFAKRKASIDEYVAAVEGAGDPDKAMAAGQAWVDANLAAYKTNCKTLVEYAKDLKKSAMADGIETPFESYMDRVHKAGGFDPKNPNGDAMRKAAELLKQFSGFFNCDNALAAP